MIPITSRTFRQWYWNIQVTWKMFSWGNSAVLLDFVQITSPPPPPPPLQFEQLVQLFSNIEIQDLKVRLSLKIFHIQYDILYIYNLKKLFKVQIIGILEEIDSFHLPKMHLWKGDKKWAGPPPPSFGQNPKEKHYFLRRTSLSVHKAVTQLGQPWYKF